MRFLKNVIISLFTLCFITSLTFAQTDTGSLKGQVVDGLGAIVIGATVTVSDMNGTTKTATTNRDGQYVFNGLKPGKYSVVVTAPKFQIYDNPEVEITAGAVQELVVSLIVEIEQQTVNVENTGQVDAEPDNNASATVLRGKDLEALPEDPDELAAALQALAGPGAGPNGGQFFIDGFAGGRLPPREAIREIRINSNPFSSEFDRLGFGRIEILTRPGAEKFRGQAFFNFNDEALNSRNPFATFRAPSQTRFFGGNLSGPIVKKKSSFFFDIDNRQVDNNAVINAVTLDAGLNVVPFRETLTVPTRRLSFSPRVDFALNDRHTLILRYSFNRNTADNQGLSEFTLPSRAFDSERTEHEFRITETAILSPTVVNETRFEYSWEQRRSEADNRIPALNVLNAFNGGGAQLGLSEVTQKDFELQNYTTWSAGKHSLKAGIRLRGIKIDNISEQNFGGSFTFAGRFGSLTSIEQYRQKILDDQNDPNNDNPLYLPTQFSITTGNPLASVSQRDVGVFINDDWRARPDLTLSFGVRYENQNNISSHLNFSPRFGFAWSPGAGGARAPKTVFRGGFGIFYDRFSENFTLQTRRFDGVRQRQYLVTDPLLLGQVIFNANGSISNVPTAAQLAALTPLSSVINTVSEDARAPYTMQGLISVERQLPYKFTLGITYIQQRTVGSLRQRNINAPFCPPLSLCTQTSPRPNPTLSNNFYQYETSGISNSQRLIFSLRTNLNPRYTIFGSYSLGRTRSDTDGGFPMYSYDLSNEYSSASFDVRHNVTFGGSINLPWKMRLNPFIIASSGRPFNITTGIDNNLDGIFNDRPSFATDLTRPSVKRTIYGDFDTQPIAGQTIIPRNYARGPSYFAVNLGLNRTFGFGKSRNAAARSGTQTGQSGNTASGPGSGGIPGIGFPGGGRPGGSGGPGGGRPGGFGGFGGFGGGGGDSPYNLTVGINVQNLFNTVNKGNPIGSLSSPLFGISNSGTGFGGFFGGFGGGGFGGGTNAGNRRIELQLRFSF